MSVTLWFSHGIVRRGVSLLAMAVLAVLGVVAWGGSPDEEAVTLAESDVSGDAGSPKKKTCDSCDGFACSYSAEEADSTNIRSENKRLRKNIEARKAMIQVLTEENKGLSEANGALHDAHLSGNQYVKVAGYTLKGAFQAGTFAYSYKKAAAVCGLATCVKDIPALLTFDEMKKAGIGLGMGVATGIADSNATDGVRVIKSIPGLNVIDTAMSANRWSSGWFGAAAQIEANSAYISGNIESIRNLRDQMKTIQEEIKANNEAIAQNDADKKEICNQCGHAKHMVGEKLESCKCEFCKGGGGSGS